MKNVSLIFFYRFTIILKKCYPKKATLKQEILWIARHSTKKDVVNFERMGTLSEVLPLISEG